jgi:hypothetical protein
MRSKVLISSVLAAGLFLPAAHAQNAPAPDKTDVKASTQMKHSGEWRASKLIGTNVYNDQNEKIGDINEVLLTSSGNVAGVVLGVGGFLGMGEHDVLVKLDQLKFVNEPVRANTADKKADQPKTTGSASTEATKDRSSERAARDANEKWYPDHAVMNATKDQLKAMPEFKYSSYN